MDRSISNLVRRFKAGDDSVAPRLCLDLLRVYCDEEPPYLVAMPIVNKDGKLVISSFNSFPYTEGMTLTDMARIRYQGEHKGVLDGWIANLRAGEIIVITDCTKELIPDVSKWGIDFQRHMRVMFFKHNAVKVIKPKRLKDDDPT